MEFATCCGEMILNYTVKAAWQQLRYIVFYKRNIKELREKLEKLDEEQISKKHSIDEATSNGELIEVGVQNWMREVDVIRSQWQQICESESTTGCQNLKSRYQLGRRATEMAKEVDTRLNQNFSKISYRQPVQAMTDMAIIGESNEGYESRVSIVNEIMEALRDADIKMIGLCGPGGVGKTTTAKEVARKVKGDMFETVVMVQVTDRPDREKIQREIAEKVDMKLNDETEAVRATRLCERLKQEKNMLLILDDLWEKLEFSRIGIPSDSRVLLTSRDERLLSNQMKCQKVLKVGFMSEDEAWKLFTQEIDELAIDREVLSIAKEIVQQCGGLPLPIVTIARVLRDKEPNEWKDTLRRLKSTNRLQRSITGIKEVDEVFMVSYDNLSPERKSIFLLSAMLSHSPLIVDLMMYSVGLGLLQDVQTMEEALVGIHVVIQKLIDSNLLLDDDSSNSDQFAIHDVVRDFALSVASSEEHALVMRHERQNRWPNKNQRKEYRSMCLDKCDINDLPEELSCPNLQFFLLINKNKNFDLRIPTKFFQSMNELKVMGFVDMRFSCLPSLQSLQEELQTLCLHSCALEDIAEVGNLKSLTVLSLAGSNIKRLPLELSQLTSLQMLNLAGCSKLEVIPPNLLSSLKGLEVLDMEDSFKQWEAEGDSEGNGNASVDELKHLTNLSSLKIQIPDASIFPKDLFKDISLERYTIVIGRKYYGWWKHEYQTFRSILYINSIYLDDGIQKLLENVEKLCSEDLKGDYTKVWCGQFSKLKHVEIGKSDQFDYVVGNSSTGPVASFSQLVEIDIKRCESMKAFVVSTQQNFVSNDVVFHQLRTLEMSTLPMLLTFYLEENTTNNECNKESKSLFNTKVSFPKLESMRLEHLNSLIPSIWDDHQLPQNSFSNLKTLKVWGCGFVKRLVPFHVLKSLSNLEELLVGDCGSLEMVFDFEELNNYDNKIQLSWVVPLRALKLRILPKLKHVWSNNPQEMKFFHEKVVHNLKRLELAGKFAMMIWNAQFPVNLFQTVQHLCLELDGSVSFARGLHNNRFPNLQVLDLSGSFTSLKEFIPTQSLNEHSQQAQNLQILILSFCDNLINMGPSLISFTNLIDIRVIDCERMTSLMTPSTSRSLVQLTKLTIMNCYEMEEIIRKQEGEEEDDGEKEIVFPKLESLELNELESLRSFCSHNYTLSFPSLQKVSIERCERMSMFCPGDIQTPSLKCVTWQGIKDEKLVDNNLNKTIQHLFTSQVSFPERMVIEDSNDLNLWIWDDQFPQNKFANLKTLIVKRCGFVERLVPFRILKSLTNLEELEVHECESLEIVFDLEELNNDEKDTHQLPWVVPLKKLELRRLAKLKHVWSNDPQQMVSFHSLQEVEASYCEKLTSMFPASIAERGLLQLEKLTIQACGINAIVAKELYVSFCDELEMFQKQVSSSSILEDEGHDTYPLFFQEKAVDNLKRLDLGGKLAMMIWNGQFPDKLFQNVQELSLELNGSISFAHGLCNDRLPNLQELNLNGWVKEFMPLLVDVAPSKLTKLVLVCVNCLKHIWNEHSQQNSLLQNIQTLEVLCCGDLINLGTSFIPFTNLTNIHVSCCFRLSSLMMPSTSRNLVQLTRLTISSCRVIEEIVRKQEGEEEDDVENEIVFQKLESLILEDLPRLRSFCDHNYTFRFPSLEEVIIIGCERMSMFCPGNIHTPLLKCVTYREIEDEKLLDSNLNNTIQLLLTQVTKLELHPEMRNIWMEKLPHHMPFSRLKHLIVDNCDFLSEYAIPTHLIRFLSKLRVLEVRNCHAIKSIFDLKGTDLDEETHKLVANIHLKKLKLHNLPNLKSVWIQNLDGSTCFQHLEELYVGECESLRNIFVASVAKGLGQLKKLSIESCGVEEIIAKDEASKESPNFVFPQLNYLKLDKLPNLKCFYPKRCLFEWPQLTDLFVSQCGNVDVFGTEITSNIESDKEDEVETQLPLFFAEKVIPKLESLSLSQQDIVTLERNGQAELFHEVQKLCLEIFLGELITFPCDFLGRFPNLNELIVNNCSFEEIFPSHVQAVDDIEEIAPFKRLRLAYLDQLKTIWNDDVDSQLPPFSQNLERLEVECCCSLVKLTPSSASLENLTHLKVSGCHQLTYLVTNSTAKSLMDRLTELEITDCTKMEEIITNENNDAEGKITFNELEGLELTNLPILKSFCLENQNFKFPKLDSLAISGCHQMKMFCHGVVETPELEFVQAEERIFLPLERDLNKTIELLISYKDG